MTSAAPDPEAFPATRWTRVLAAQGDSERSRAALADLCEIYYPPVAAFIRCSRPGQDPEKAKDLAQAFFERFLARPGMAGLERGRGRFRSYLLGAVKHFLAEAAAAERAGKRGGAAEFLFLNAEPAEGSHSLPAELSQAPAPDAFYDRAWALTVLQRALSALEEEHAASGQSARFAALKPWLAGEAAPASQSEAAAALGLSAGATKVAIHRLRVHFRQLVSGEIADTLEDPSELRAELAYLADALSRG